MYDIIPDKVYEEQNMLNTLVFELRSLLGRLLCNTKPKLNRGKNLLNFGCGDRYHKGWINADFFILKKSKCNCEWNFDFRYKFNCPNDIWDGVFTEHVIEHFPPYTAMNIMKELYRTMKPDAYIRIVLPDLKKYIEYYNCDRKVKIDDRFYIKFKSGAEAIWNIACNFGHKSVWDGTTLKRALHKTGFINIKEKSYKSSDCIEIMIDAEDRKWESFYMEAQKPHNSRY